MTSQRSSDPSLKPQEILIYQRTVIREQAIVPLFDVCVCFFLSAFETKAVKLQDDSGVCRLSSHVPDSSLSFSHFTRKRQTVFISSSSGLDFTEKSGKLVSSHMAHAERISLLL